MEETKAREGMLTGKKRWIMIIGVLLISVTSQAASYGQNLVLPGKLESFGLNSYYSIYATMGGLGMMIALPLAGVLGGRFGVKRMTIIGLVSQFAIRFALMFAPNMALFTLLWAVMGLASGLYMSAPYTIMATLIQPEERSKFYGYIATASAIGTLVGPGLTGAVIDAIGADAGLIVYGIFAIIPLVSLTILYPNQKNSLYAGKKFDFVGLLFLVVFVCCTVLWLCMYGTFFPVLSVPGILMPAAAAAALAGLILYEAKVDNPSVPIAMFKRKRFRATFCIQFLLVAYSTCIIQYAVRYVTLHMGGTSLMSSTVTYPQTIVQAVLGLFVGVLIGKHFKKRFRILALSELAIYLAALLLLSTLQPTSSMIVIYAATAIGGISQALSQSLHAAFFQSELQPAEIGKAQGMFQFASTGGGSIFGAVAAAFVNHGANYNQIFLVGAAFVGAALVIALFTFRFSKEEIEEAERAIAKH